MINTWKIRPKNLGDVEQTVMDYIWTHGPCRTSSAAPVFRRTRMRVLAVAVFALILGSSSFCSAQLTVNNPKHLYFPEDRAKVIFSTACRIVATEFHVEKASKIDFPLVVVVGDPNERYTGDLRNHVFTIYLDHWDETQFATSSMGLAIQLLIPQEERLKIITQILRRSEQVLPVSVNAFKRVP
jgi:hypothetical protein